MAGSKKAMKLPSSMKTLSKARTISSQYPLRKPTYSITTADLESDTTSHELHHDDSPPPSKTMPPKPPPLSVLPLSSLLRSIAINTISSSPLLLPPSLRLMSLLANSHSPILNPDRNPLLRWFLKKTFYAQFCAGENSVEVAQTMKSLKEMGFKGIMLCYAKEVVLDEAESNNLDVSAASAETESPAAIEKEILPWKTGTLETVSMTTQGDFVAVKFTGAGSSALSLLSQNQPPSPALDAAITEICDLAASRGVRLAFDAEQQSLQSGIFSWTVEYARRYNGEKATVFVTYQAYLKAAPRVLAEHLAMARKEGWCLGVKLVRGAYMATDPRELIHDTKAQTDACYDGIAESVLRRRYGDVLRPVDEKEKEMGFPNVSLVLACHNLDSVRKARAIRAQQARDGVPRVDMVYAQLQGMADEISCELVQDARAAEACEAVAEREAVVEPRAATQKERIDVPQAYKYLVWGSTGECMKYLHRRAQENKDAVQRTREGRNLMVGEIVRRVFGLGAR
jgi:proline dehydrogenase